jgi:predicted nucleic acid-binding protein
MSSRHAPENIRFTSLMQRLYSRKLWILWVIKHYSEVVELATEIRAHSRLKTPDALHLAAAIHHGCTEFWTNDNRLMQAAVGRIQIINPLT